MPFHLAAFTESQDSATLVPVAALRDTILSVVGDDLRVDRVMNKIVGVYVLGPDLTRAQLRSPTLQRLWFPELTPLDLAAEPSSPQVFHDYRFSPIELGPTENLNAFAAEGGAGATRATFLVLFSDAPISPVDGDIRTLRLTNTDTLVANAWTNGQLTLDQNLQPGEYEIVGMRYEGAGAHAARLVFREGGARPGVVGVDAQSDLQAPQFRRGAFGSFGRFFHDALPSVDFLSNSADTSQVVYLDLILRSSTTV